MNSYTQFRRLVRAREYSLRSLIVCLLLLLVTQTSSAQVIMPAVNTPIDATTPLTARDTLLNDSSFKLLNLNVFRSYINQSVVKSLYPSLAGAPGIADPVWQNVNYQNTYLHMSMVVDSDDYLSTFSPGSPLIRGLFSLLVYAPGDSNLTTPIAFYDSLYLEMSSETPRVEQYFDITSAISKYIPLSGRSYVDTTDTLGYVRDLTDSINIARLSGRDSILLGGSIISLDSAIYLADSADMAFRGISIGGTLQRNLPMYFKLVYSSNPINYIAAGLDLNLIRGQVDLVHGIVLPGSYIDPTHVRDPGGVVILPSGGHTTWPCNTPIHTVTAVLDNPIKYVWDECPVAPNYEIQVLRLYNTDPSLSSNPHHIKAKVDWSQALDLETNNGQLSIRLTTAEGSGYYVWRVRRIDDAYPNTVGDNRNWGLWSPTGAFVDGATVEVTSGSTTSYLFYYDVFSDTVNWIYHRQFVEGEIDHGSQLRIGEKTTFANYLLMPEQEQVRAQGADTILASQTIPDFSGRPLMQTLPAPVGKHGFEYEYKYIRTAGDSLYTANDYDQQWNFKTPRIVGGTSKLVKYYSNQNGDPQIPNCDSIPFTRTLNYNDGLNRSRMVGSPGKYHDLTSGHEVKKYYCSPTATELIRIFGDEAPRSASVLKTYTVDPNGVINISYTDEITGKVLATCLSAPESQLLDTIPGNHFIVRDTVSDKTPYSGAPHNRMVETKTYTFAVPTKLNFLYRIIPGIYGDACAHMCSSCDYKVYLSAMNIDDTVSGHMFRDSLIILPVTDSLGGPCSSSMRGDSGTYKIVPLDNPPGSTAFDEMLDPGTYVVTAVVLLGNSDPATNVPYVVEADSVLMRNLRHQIWTDPGFVIGGNSGLTLTTIKTYLDARDLTGLLAYTGADTSQPYFNYVVDCDTLQLPTVHCKTHDCSTIDFAEYMVGKLAQYDATHGTSVFSGVSDISATTDAANLFLLGPAAGNAEFDAIIGRMITDGYNCDSLWNAWVQTVQWYITTETSLTPVHHADWWQHYLETVGFKFPFKQAPYSELSTLGSSVRKFPYKYFPYDIGSNLVAETNFCYIYESSYLGLSLPTPWSCSHTPSDWMPVIHNYPYDFPSSSFHMWNFYLNIKPSSPSYLAPISGSSVGTPGGTATPSMYAHMEHECYDACNGRYNEYADAIAQKYMEGGVSVEGYSYLSWYPQPPTASIDLPRLYCLTSALVSGCKAGCRLEPDPVTGVVPPEQIAAYTASMTYTAKIEVSLTTPPDCHPETVCLRDTSAWVPIDSTICTTYNGATHCYTMHMVVERHWCLEEGVDNNYYTFYNNDDSYSQNAALLSWINHRYNDIYDSLTAIGFPFVYPWDIAHDKGMESFGAAGLTCTQHTTGIDIDKPKGFYTWDTGYVATDYCAANKFTVKRIVPTTAFPNSNIEVKFEVTLDPLAGISGSVPDSISILEHIPPGATIIPGSCDGYIDPANVIHFTAVGPIAGGAVRTFSYFIRMPATPGDSYIFNGEAVKYMGGSPSSCGLTQVTSTVKNCIDLYFNLPGYGPAQKVCSSCFDAMNCDAGICMYFAPPKPVTADSTHVITCAEFMTNTFTSSLNIQIQHILDRHSDVLMNMYASNCNTPEAINDLFVNSYDLNQYQYTLYYYDRAGNLVRTVAPRGVRDTATSRYGPPLHYDVSQYDYNTLGQMLRQQTPDGGETYFWYDKRGKVRLSQNAKQRPLNAYSYTIYDELARVIESGEIKNYTTVDTNDIFNPSFPVTGGLYPKRYTTQTVYSKPCPVSLPNYGVYTGSNLQNRISYVVTDADGNPATTGDEATSIYNYDTHGNVAELVQYVGGAPNAVVMRYQYDVISNKVLKMSQQKLSTSSTYEDYLAHKYSYDGDKRLTSVATTHLVNATWVTDARYNYYLHGPLRRHLIGDSLGIQGVDYTYTLQGWLKGINHSSLRKNNDPGKDSTNYGGKRADIWGMVLNYYHGDFNRTGSPFNSIGNYLNLETGNPVVYGGGDLYNGNITSWQQHIRKPSSLTAVAGQAYERQWAYAYRYDQLNRIDKSKFWYWDEPIGTAGLWRMFVTDGLNPYDENFSYDRNGNIKTLNRTSVNSSGSAVVETDRLTYTYNTNSLGDPINQLGSVADADGNVGLGDVDPANSYTYDGIGQLTKETSSNNVLKITWTPYGKVDTVVRTTPSSSPLGSHQYLYDAMGNQVRDIHVNSSSLIDTTYNIYDGHNVKLASYHLQTPGIVGNRMYPMERYLYGSERLGVLKGPSIMGLVMVIQTLPVRCIVFVPGIIGAPYRLYELHDHLGNVRATIKAVSPPPSGVTAEEYYNYYAFGSYHPKRTQEPVFQYTFGFNGQEKKDDWRGAGNSEDFGARNYDSRIGRWMSVDPLANKYPNQTPYGYVGNSPIVNKEKGGRDYAVYVDHDKHTIDIKATFYTLAGDANSLASATKAAQFWNNQSGNFKYVVGKGSGAVEYSVKFTMTVVPVKDPEGERRNDHEQYSPENRKTKDKSSNTYGLKPDKDPIFDNADKNEDTRGKTVKGREVYVKESEQNSDVGEHEMGHALGLGHFFRGVLTAALNDPDHALEISREYVAGILKNALSAIKDLANGDLFEKGVSPKNFGKGKMVETKQH